MINDHDQWLYDSDGKGRIFRSGEEIPVGWTDKRNSDEWDAPPVKPMVKKVKYPSQMNKTELIEFGEGIDIELDEAMTKSEMLDAINTKMMEVSE